MRVILLLLSYLTLSLSQEIEIDSNWKLLGTSERIDDIGVFNRDCLKSIWRYEDGKWLQFKPNDLSSNLKSLDKEVGFWIVGERYCKFSTDDEVENLPESSKVGFKTLKSWDELAVRKVLHLFAYGSFATDSQIKIWADMEPSIAIVEMLNFEFSNPKISPIDFDKLNRFKSFEELSRFWSMDGSLVDDSNRDSYKVTSWNSPSKIWISALNRRGLNPFRERVGLFETNYHMVVNRNVGVYPQVIINYYDMILNSLKSNLPYEEVLAKASSSSAIAYQYGHNRNIFKDGKFRGNEDFAREFHQLFFGILGEYDRDYHEFYSIRNTAKALTGIEANWHSENEGGPDIEATYNRESHYPSSLEILKAKIDGADAREKLFNLSKVAIGHLESLDNLPVKIISHFGDDFLSEIEIEKIRKSWRDLESKNLLEFLRAYATSEMFHSKDRFKYYSAIDRNMILLNKLTLDNQESYLNIYNVEGYYWYLSQESATPFRPIHDVFGHQTSLEASDSGAIFQNGYNRATKDSWFFTRDILKDKRDNVIWRKDWAKVIPKSENGEYIVKDVAKWLWNYLVADGGKNFQTLEMAHLYTLLASGEDLALFLDRDNPTKIYTLSELEGDRLIVDKIADAGISRLELDSSDEELRKSANIRVGRAVAFISAAPYMFAQEGR